MPDNTSALVVAAADGLGTRVHSWARIIPKEFYPIDGRPGITRLLEEIAGLGSARVVIVYHPYYEQFAAWVRQVLSQHDHSRYVRAVGVEAPATVRPGLTVSLIPQHSPYGDLTSVLHGADFLGARDGLYVAFATTSTAGSDHSPGCATPPTGRSRCCPAGTSPRWPTAAASSSRAPAHFRGKRAECRPWLRVQDPLRPGHSRMCTAP